jgi:TolB protein
MKRLAVITILVLSAAMLVLVVMMIAARHASAAEPAAIAPAMDGPLHFKGEVHLANIKQLTFGGENAEGYFSADGKKIIFQSTRPPYQCDQIFMMNSDGSDVHLISTGKGRTTCSFIAPDNSQIIYSSTHLKGEGCPPVPPHGPRYIWPVYDYDIFAAKLDGSDPHPLTHNAGYNAESVYSPKGDKILFTSDREGDLELYTMNPDGSDQKRLTHMPGYDGGGWFTFDGKQIVFRGEHPTDSASMAEYKDLLINKREVEPRFMELYIMNADGSDVRQLTHGGRVNFAPFPHPSGKAIVFCSNYELTGRGEYALYLYHLADNRIERVTFSGGFDGFPMFSYDGKKIVFASNRNGSQPHETNLFIADWVE